MGLFNPVRELMNINALILMRILITYFVARLILIANTVLLLWLLLLRFSSVIQI